MENQAKSNNNFFKSICSMYDDFIDGELEKFQEWLEDSEAPHKPCGFTSVQLSDLPNCPPEVLHKFAEGFMYFQAKTATVH